ncbi:MAG TPA: phosphoribosylanthranilate isomerase [Acidimicrobiia bacterium]|nr:phosphoribosylanthranilate isomerase [Acidimicrobiia bacterium]
MSLFVKLCGLRTPADVETAIEVGASAVGFVLTPSSRQIPLSYAARLNRMLPASVLGVAVLNNPAPDLIERALAEVAPDLLQVEYRRGSGLPADTLLPVVVNGDGLEEAVTMALRGTERGMVLVDTAAKGGTGRKSDWGRIAALAERDRVIVAGGLNPGNVGEAISLIHPHGVDVSSGIEARPGEKDPGLMRAFVEAARSAELRGARL